MPQKRRQVAERLLVLLFGDLAERLTIVADVKALPSLQRQPTVVRLREESLENLFPLGAELQEGVADGPVAPLRIRAAATVAEPAVQIAKFRGNRRAERIDLALMLGDDHSQRGRRTIGNNRILMPQRSQQHPHGFDTRPQVAQSFGRGETDKTVRVM